MRTIVEQPVAAEALNRAVERWSRAWDSWQAVTWVIMREPDTYLSEALTESGLSRSFTYDGAKSIDMPTVTVVYEFRPDQIVIHEARFEESKYAQAGRA
jgi:hypothetical protein